MASSRYSCPYVEGAEFVMILRHSYSGSAMCHMRVKVCHTYPFTKSQAMKVEILNCDDAPVQLPRFAFLKLYDRRYLDERKPDGPNPWTHDKEAMAKMVARKITPQYPSVENLLRQAEAPWPARKQERKLAFERVGGYEEDTYKKVLKSLSKSLKPEAIEQWKVELRYRGRTTSWFKTECRAYHQLKPLQDDCIPILYGATAFDKTADLPAGIHTDVLGILLEY